LDFDNFLKRKVLRFGPGPSIKHKNVKKATLFQVVEIFGLLSSDVQKRKGSCMKWGMEPIPTTINKTWSS
jgi:hypothetical protein